MVDPAEAILIIKSSSKHATVEQITPDKAKAQTLDKKEESSKKATMAIAEEIKIEGRALIKSVSLNPEFFMRGMKRKKFADFYYEIGLSICLK